MTQAPQHPDDVTALRSALEGTATRLHGIASRTDSAQIAAEVLRLNDAVRAGSHGLLRAGDHPLDFAALLVAASDSVNADPPA